MNAKQNPQQHFNIAVIDDDELFCISLRKRFSQHNHIRIELICNSGDAFFEHYVNHAIHMILLDISMPRKNGVEVMREITQRKINVPVFVFSDLLYKEYVDQLYELGVKKCIKKGPLEILEHHIQEYFKLGRVQDQPLTVEDINMLISICNENHLEQIADTMNKGKDVIKKRKASLAKKLSIKNSDLQFLKWAIRHGYYDVS